jgi:hypothetical protein
LLRDIRRDPPRLVFGEQLAADRRPAPFAPPEMPGLFTGFDRLCVIAQESVMEFCGNPMF